MFVFFTALMGENYSSCYWVHVWKGRIFCRCEEYTSLCVQLELNGLWN